LSSKDLRRTAPAETAGASTPIGAAEAVERVWLEHDGKVTELAQRPLLIGRADGCDIVLDDAKVSRRHAQIGIEGGAVVVEDLGSVNGVHVGGGRITGKAALQVGERFVVGNTEFWVRPARPSAPVNALRGTIADTLNGVRSPLADRVDEPSETSMPADSLELLGGVAEKMLARGLPEEAERVLGSFLNNLLVGARGKRALDSGLVERASTYALRVAQGTNRTQWVDWVVEIHRALERPVAARVVETLYHMARQLPPNLQLLRDYVSDLNRHQERWSPAERFLVQRIAGLERVISAR
jgi:pSer/pThr/pTyr-binding forkhead associated (FHA) protein